MRKWVWLSTKSGSPCSTSTPVLCLSVTCCSFPGNQPTSMEVHCSNSYVSRAESPPHQPRVLPTVPVSRQGPPGLLVLPTYPRSCRALVATGAKRPQTPSPWLAHYGGDNTLGGLLGRNGCSRCSKTSLFELQDSGRELKSCQGLDGG